MQRYLIGYSWGLIEEKEANVEKEMQEEPIGFTKHKVRRKETLFGIAKRYNISEEDIKRYNTSLYAVQLKKGMRLKIPKYMRIAVSESLINEDDYEIYTVKEKETRWSIAHAYGISIDSMIVLNPTLSETTDYLAVDQELKLPKLLGSTEIDQEVQIYNSYTVPKGIGFYPHRERLWSYSRRINEAQSRDCGKRGIKRRYGYSYS